MDIEDHGYTKTEYAPGWIYTLTIISDSWCWAKEEEKDSFEL